MKLNYKTTAQLDTNFVPDLKVYFITKLIGDDQIYSHKEMWKFIHYERWLALCQNGFF